MEIYIDDKLLISTDKHNFILSEYVERKKRKEDTTEWVWIDVGYFPTLSSVCVYIITKYNIQRQDKLTILQLIDVIKDSTKQIKQLIETSNINDKPNI